jgi:hypothetical protein
MIARRRTVRIACPRRSVVRYSADLKTRDEFPVAALTLDVKGKTGHVWVVTTEEIVEMDRKGKTLSRTKHKTRTLQAWIASW